MKWVKHDTDANLDAKLQNVLLDYGLEGYGLYWYCIELIAGNVTKENITFELEHDARIIARNTGNTAQKVEEMMRYFVKVGLFEHSGGTISCMKLAKRLDKSMTSNPEMRSIIEQLKSHDPVMITSENSHDEVMQDETRLDETRLDKPLSDSQAKSNSYDWDLVIEQWNAFAEANGLAKINLVGDKRERVIKQSYQTANKLQKKAGGEPLDFSYFVVEYLTRAHHAMTDFHRGEEKGSKWKANFNYVFAKDVTETLLTEGELRR